MNIVFIGAYDTPDFGGINSYMLNLSKQLERMGHKCIILRQSNRNYETVIEEICFVNIKTRGGMMGMFELYSKAAKLLKQGVYHCDVACFQDFLYAPVVGRKLIKQGVLTCYLQHSFACDNPKNSKWMYFAEILLTKLSLFFTKNTITVGESIAELMRKRLRINPEIVRGGIFMPYDKLQLPDRLNNIEKDEYFLTIARIDPVKKIDILIDGFLKYKGNKKLVIGGNVNNDYGRMLVEKAKNDKRIIFMGAVSGDVKNFLLKNCFGYCLVSSSEGFPISLLEAMAFGKRCITSNIPQIEEAISKELGVWCEVGSSEDITKALQKLESDQHRAENEDKIRSRVKANFTWEVSANSFLKVIEKFKAH